MALLDFLLGSNQQAPMGGVAGQLMQAQPQGIVAQQQPLMQQRPKFWQTPEFAGTLSRLGANLAAASTQNAGFLDSLSLAAAQTVKDNEAARAQGMQNQLLQAQINKANAEAQPASPFSGTGFENQVAGTYYNAYLQQGLSPMEAQIKAAQAVFNREPTYITNAEGQLIPIPGRTLPTIGTATAPTPATAPAAAPTAQPDAIDQTAASLGLPAGTLLPPPSGTQPQGAMPTQGVLPAPSFMTGGQIAVPQVAGPKTQQALTQRAGEKQIDIAAESLQSQNERSRELPRFVDDVESGLNAIDKILADPNRGAISGGPLGLEGRLSSALPITESQRKLQPLVNQLKGQVFLDAFNALRGGGAITQVEGQKAETARARISDQYTPGPEYDQALLDLREVLKKGLERAKSGVVLSPQEIAGQATAKAQDLINRPAPNTSNTIPQGVDPALWNLMTPQERALWQQ